MALFAIVGGLAVDCVRQDHPEHLPRLVEGIADVVEDELSTWINENGGWVRFNPLYLIYQVANLLQLLSRTNQIGRSLSVLQRYYNYC